MHEQLTPTQQWHNVTAQSFRENIAPLYQPAIFKNAVNHWEVIELAKQSPESLTKYRSPSPNKYPPVELFVGEKDIEGRYSYGQSMDSFNFKRVKTDLESVLKHLNSSQEKPADVSTYAGAVDIRTQMPLFSEFNSAPSLLEGQQADARAWIGSASKIATHFDVQDNIACLVSGAREFVLFPPEQIANLYVGPIDNTIAGPPSSLVDIDSPNFNQFPLYAEALKSAQIAVLEPGDALYIPSLWWHNVRSTGSFCMLVNYWWDNHTYRKNNTMLALIHGLYAISHLPDKEREAWRSLFDYYIFQLDGPPLQHLPDDQRGVLGPMTQQRYRMIEHYLLQSMNPSNRQ